MKIKIPCGRNYVITEIDNIEKIYEDNSTISYRTRVDFYNPVRLIDSEDDLSPYVDEIIYFKLSKKEIENLIENVKFNDDFEKKLL